MNVNFVKLSKTAKTPSKGSTDSAGYDLYADVNDRVIILPHTTLKINTNIAVEIPNGCFGGIYARSGIATKRGLRPANCVGVIDSDYRGNIVVAVHNDSNESQIIEPDERIAQLIIQPYLNVDLKEVSSLSNTERGYGGFGSTGK